MPTAPCQHPGATRLSAIERSDGIGRIVIEADRLDSTNRRLVELGRAGAGHGTILIARDQTAGRGKGERGWFSAPDGSLCLSVLVRTGRGLREAAQLPLLAAVALREAILAETGVAAGVKWPNDLLAGGRKICGILAEAACDGDGDLDFVVIGMGINLAIPEAGFPENLRQGAVSLATLSGRPVDRDGLVASLAMLLDGWVKRWEGQGLPAFAEAWTAHALHLGHVVRLTDGDEDICATLIGLAADGALRICDAAGTVRDVHSGEIQSGETGLFPPVAPIPSQLPKTRIGAFS
ncbi:biotin--[acetyl-CoA-carboxylase] ligase (plasmid) [Azospirillum humicireducens]|uniref:biotin--[biotin carboxyl-carrier protein] ligase n=1 Tax=Azospirillum humicireducens TaxID=1226968 RepID=A0A2R4VU06_9PROT|nr:biotin--[acetyl-CoA-carboxylase] ligase [Azospirillum humicireducens]AWB07926.1 biotin--[acetyl-CoA-carboxylase] ligase [Azospirillum humicireducens]